MPRICSTALAVACTVAMLQAVAQVPTATLTIQADKPLHAVSPMLYGLMTEEINYSYDGGLYAEMVRNRTFTDRGWAGIGHWNVENAGNAQAKATYDGDTGPTAALPGSMLIDVTQADAKNPAGVRNEGWWGMNVQPNTTYTGSLYARAENGGNIGVSLVNDNSGKSAATATVSGLSTEWKQYTFTLHTGSTPASVTNHLLLSFPQTGKVWIDLVSLFPPTYKNRANGNRTDLMQMMAGLHPKFLRMPGGNYLEGDQIDERFDWKNTLGPLADRPTHRGTWSYQSSDGLGLLEFLEWTEDLNIEPVLAVYAGYSLKGDYIHPGPALTPYVDDAMDELEFVTGGPDTKWGAVRAKLGHPNPFPLHYVEVGNEDEFDKSGSYEGRFAQFNRAIKAKYPSLQVIATKPLKRTVPDVVDDHYYKRAEEFFDMLHKYDDMPRTGPKIFVGEWATREGAPTTNMGAALGDAAFMTSMERNSDLIVLSAYAPMLVNVNPGGMQWESDLVGYNTSSTYGSPGYYAQALFAEFLGTEVSTTTLTGANTRFFTSVTRDPAAGLLYVKLVNASTESQVLDVRVNGAKAGGSSTIYTLHGNTRAETNSITDPRRIVPVKSTVRAGDMARHTVPPLSVQVIVLPAK
ncbi:MAG: alpha-L-arabinofuranosidase C-terminal domain-containing protein [Janthinobacterium lividum]